MIRPLRPEVASPEALAVNDRNLAACAAELPPCEVLARLIDLARAAGEPVAMVGHNLASNLDFLNCEEASYGLAVPRRRRGQVRPGQGSSGGPRGDRHLQAGDGGGLLRDRQAHDAQGDVRATARILERFKSEAPVLVDREIEGTLISGLLADAEAAQPGSPFVASVSGQYNQKWWLSTRQISALVRIAAERAAGERNGAVTMGS